LPIEKYHNTLRLTKTRTFLSTTPVLPAEGRILDELPCKVFPEAHNTLASFAPGPPDIIFDSRQVKFKLEQQLTNEIYQWVVG